MKYKKFLSGYGLDINKGLLGCNRLLTYLMWVHVQVMLWYCLRQVKKVSRSKNWRDVNRPLMVKTGFSVYRVKYQSGILFWVKKLRRQLLHVNSEYKLSVWALCFLIKLDEFWSVAWRCIILFLLCRIFQCIWRKQTAGTGWLILSKFFDILQFG